MTTDAMKNDDEKTESPPALSGLDPALPAYHMVSQPLMADLIEVLQELPWKQVNRIMPQLVQSPLANAGPMAPPKKD